MTPVASPITTAPMSPSTDIRASECLRALWPDRWKPLVLPPSKKERKASKRASRKGHSAPPMHPFRKLVYTRDGYRCVECGTDRDLTLDHIRPKSKGGTGHPDNLQTMCAPCNNAKGNDFA